MMSASREKSAIAAQNKATVTTRLRAIIRRFDLSQTEIAAVMRVSERTARRWLAGEIKPPPIATALLDIIEQSSQGRRILGVHTKSCTPRGRPFRRGNEYRFSDKRRKEAIQRAKAASR
jgi:DNA-binding transcriptional regulator YiaG